MSTNNPLNNDSNTLGARISALRKLRKISRNDMISSLGISHASLSRLENDVTTKINSDMIIKLTNILDVSCDYLILGHEYIPSHDAKSIYSEAYRLPEIYELITLYQSLPQEDRTKALTYLNFLKKFKGED